MLETDVSQKHRFVDLVAVEADRFQQINGLFCDRRTENTWLYALRGLRFRGSLFNERNTRSVSGGPGDRDYHTQVTG